MLNQFTMGLRLNRSYFLITCLSGLLAVMLGMIWIGKLGASGVAFALLLSHSIGMLLQLLIVLNRIKQEKQATFGVIAG
jgi:membrane associated rhomboid family serine protease